MAAITKVNDLRTILIDEINRVRSGKTTAANANAVVNASSKILHSIKMEIEYAKQTGKELSIDFMEK